MNQPSKTAIPPKNHRGLKLGAVLTVFFAIILILIYFQSSLSRVNQISVTGTNGLSEQQVIDASGLSTNDALWDTLIHKNKVVVRTKAKLQKVKSLTISRVGLNNIRIKIVEYQTVGYLMTNNRYQEIIQNGQIVRKSLKNPIGNYPVYNRFKAGNKLKKMTKVYSGLPSKIQHSISEIRLSTTKSNPYRIHLYMNDGNEIIADIRTVGSKMKYYPTIAKQMSQKGIIDIEVGAYSYPFSDQNK